MTTALKGGGEGSKINKYIIMRTVHIKINGPQMRAYMCGGWGWKGGGASPFVVHSSEFLCFERGVCREMRRRENYFYFICGRFLFFVNLFATSFVFQQGASVLPLWGFSNEALVFGCGCLWWVLVRSILREAWIIKDGYREKI